MRKRNKILLAAAAIILLFILIGAWILFSSATNFDEKKKYLYVRDLNNVPDNILHQTDTAHLIKNFGAFKTLAAAWNVWSRVKPGRFEIAKGENLYSILQKLRHNEQSDVRLVINKLRINEDLAKVIGKTFSSDSSQTISFLNDNEALKYLGIDSNLITSIIIPDTYFFNWTSSPKIIIERLKNEHEKFWEKDNRRQKADALGLSPLQVTTIASIVEEETNKNDEKGNIASVYINRFKKGMPLGADPTIKFALKDFKLKRILYKDLEISSPYNTYINKGLPPGPICTPQTVTIDAVLNAPRTDYLFFVAESSFNGYHHFSNNFAEHDRYAKLYQQALTVFMKRKKEKEDSLQNIKPQITP